MSFLDGYNFGSRAPGPAERDRCDEGGESATICVKELMDLGSVRGRGSDSAPPSGGDRCGGGGDGTTICVRELMDLSGIRRGLALGSGPAEQSTQGPTGQAQASAPGPAPGHGPAAPSVPPQSPSHSQLKMASKRPTVDIPGRREAPEVTLGAGERAKEDDAGTRVGRQGGEEKSAPRAEDATPKSTNSPASTYSPASTSSAAGGVAVMHIDQRKRAESARFRFMWRPHFYLPLPDSCL